MHSPKTKELHYFSNRGVYDKGVDWYSKQFDTDYDGAKAIGEYTPNYLWASDDESEIAESNLCRDIPANVSSLLPEAKLIVILRNPVERAVSAYFHHIRAGRIHPNENFDNAVKKYGIASKGLYSDQLKKWFDHFDKNQFLILFYEESLFETKYDTLQSIYKHIEVDPDFIPRNMEKSSNKRESYLEMRIKPYSRILAIATRTVVPDRIKSHPRFEIPVSQDSKIRLQEYFKSPNKELEELLSREVPW